MRDLAAGLERLRKHAEEAGDERMVALCRVAQAADIASLQYGRSTGRMVPEMEQLGWALDDLAAPVSAEEEP